VSYWACKSKVNRVRLLCVVVDSSRTQPPICLPFPYLFPSVEIFRWNNGKRGRQLGKAVKTSSRALDSQIGTTLELAWESTLVGWVGRTQMTVPLIVHADRTTTTSAKRMPSPESMTAQTLCQARPISVFSLTLPKTGLGRCSFSYTNKDSTICGWVSDSGFRVQETGRRGGDGTAYERPPRKRPAPISRAGSTVTLNSPHTKDTRFHGHPELRVYGVVSIDTCGRGHLTLTPKDHFRRCP
jgi:hypothetical protein